MSYDILEREHIRPVYSRAIELWYKSIKGGLTMTKLFRLQNTVSYAPRNFLPVP